MKFEYLLLVLGLVCLAVPTSAICTRKVRDKLRQPSRRREDGIASLLRSRFNWFDLVRGGVGAWLVHREFTRYAAGQDDLMMTMTIVELSVLFLAIVAQTIWIHRPMKVVGPAFFLTGLTLVTSGPLAGGFALVLGFTCALMFGRLRLAFVLVPISLVAFGMVFGTFGLTILFNAVLFFLPAFAAFVTDERIVFVRRPIGLRVSSFEPSPVVPLVPEGMVISPDFTNPRGDVAAAHLA